MGRAHSEQSVWIEEHVATCQACVTSMGQVPDDKLAAILRSPPTLAELRSHYSDTRTLAGITTSSSNEGLHYPSNDMESLETIGGFRLLKLLGQGGMGIVYLAWQATLRRHVALKMIARGASAKPEDMRRFQREAEASASLRHENIAQIYEVGEQDGNPYIAMELVEGCTLSRYLVSGPLPLEDSVQLLLRLSSAIDHAHTKSIIHRDLKPSNILLAGCTLDEPSKSAQKTKKDLVPKIVDFGLAKHIGQLDSPTLTGDLIGTPNYMSPEQARGETSSMGVGTDVYSLGAILYEVLVGRPPYQGAGPVETLEQVRSQEPARPSSLRSGVPRDLETICLKCLEKNPAQRYVSAKELHEDLLRFRSGRPIQARPASWLTRTVKWIKRNPVLATFFVSLFFGAASLLAMGVQYNRSVELALRKTLEAKKQANTNFQFAMRSIEQMLERVGFDQLTDRPMMEEVRAELLGDAVRFYSELLSTQPESDLESQRIYGRALARQGSILGALGKHEAGLQNIQQAIDLQTQLLHRHPNDYAIQHELAIIYINRGLIDRTAESNHKAIELLKKIETTIPQSRRELAQALSNLATVTSQVEDRETHHLSALRLRRELLVEAPEDSRMQFGLGQTLHNLGLVYLITNRLPQAVNSMTEAIGIFEALVSRNGAASDYQYSLAESYSSLAVMQKDLGEIDQAIPTNTKGTNLRSVLADRFPKVPALRQSLARSYLTHASLLLTQNRFAEATELCQRAVSIAEDLDRESPSRDRKIFVAASLTILATSATGLEDKGTSRSTFERATELYNELLQADPSDEYCQSEAGVNCMNYSNILRAENPTQALEYNDRSVEILERLLAAHPTRQDYQQYAFNSNGARAQTLESLGRHAEAAKAWARLIELCPLDQRVQYELLEALALARSGATTSAAAKGQRLVLIEGLGGADLYNIACLFGVLDANVRTTPNPSENYRDQALRILNMPAANQFLQQEANRAQLLVDPDLESVRLHPEFQNLIGRLN
jgi:eukaryotic-like serine/threonine-protein kinase